MRPSLWKGCGRLGASLVVVFAAVGLARCGGQSTLLGPEVSDGAADAPTSSGPDGSAVRDAAPDAALQGLPGVHGSAPDAAHPEAALPDDAVSDAGIPDVAPTPIDAPEEAAPALPPCGPPLDSTYYVDPLSTFDAGAPMGGRGCPFVRIDEALDAIRASRLATDASASPATVLLVNDATAPYLTPDSFTVPADVTIRAQDVTKNTPFLEFGYDAGNFGGTVTMNQPNARLSYLVMDGLRNGIGMSGAGTNVDHVTVENTVFRGIDSSGSGVTVGPGVVLLSGASVYAVTTSSGEFVLAAIPRGSGRRSLGRGLRSPGKGESLRRVRPSPRPSSARPARMSTSSSGEGSAGCTAIRDERREYRAWPL